MNVHNIEKKNVLKAKVILFMQRTHGLPACTNPPATNINIFIKLSL